MSGPLLFVGASVTAAHVSIAIIIYPGISCLLLLGMLAWCCPCILVGRIAENLGEDRMLCTLGALFGILFVPAIYVAIRVLIRNKLREQKGIGVS